MLRCYSRATTPDRGTQAPCSQARTRRAARSQAESALLTLGDSHRAAAGSIRSTTEADKVWFEQQRLDVAADDELRLVALHNDRGAFELVLKERLPHLVAARHGENAKMFDLFFNDPRFRKMFLEYVGESTHEEFRGDRAGI